MEHLEDAHEDYAGDAAAPAEPDPRYEFCAPQFHDFNQPEVEDDQADTWFEQTADGQPLQQPEPEAESEPEPELPAKSPADEMEEAAALLAPPAPPAAPAAQPAHEEKRAETKQPLVERCFRGGWQAAVPSHARRTPSSLSAVSSASSAKENAAPKPRPKLPAQPRRVPVASTHAATTAAAAGSQPAFARLATKPTAAWAARVAKEETRPQPRPAASAPPVAQRLFNRPTQAWVAKVHEEKKHEAPAAAAAPAAAPALTVAKSPAFRTEARLRAHRTATQSTEEMAMRAVEEAARDMAELRRHNQERVQAVLLGRGKVLPVRSTAKLTEPEEFRFFTAARAAAHSRSSSAASTPSHSARASSVASAQQPSRSRLASLSTPRSVQRAASGAAPAETPQQQVPLEKMLRAPDAHLAHFTPRVTRPVSPKLSHSTARRKQPPLSQRQRESMEMRSMPRFHARPLRPEVMHSAGDRGVPRVAKAKPTEFHEFRLATEQRAASHRKPQQPQDESFPAFKARPVGWGVAQGVSAPRASAAAATPRAPTKPISPPLSKSNRAPRPKTPESEPFRARPVPRTAPFVPQHAPAHAPAHALEAEPFQLLTEARGEEHARRRAQEEQKRRLEEEEQRHFKAQPMRVTEPFAPQPAPAGVTEPEPFELASVRRAEERRAAIEAQRLAQLEQFERMANGFHARPAPKAEPFVPHKAPRAPTRPEPVELHSSLRAAEREAFERRMLEQRHEAELRQQQEAAERAAREAEEIRALRAATTFKARPVMRGEPLLVTKSAKELTRPASPVLSTKQRAVRSHSLVHAAENLAANR